MRGSGRIYNCTKNKAIIKRYLSKAWAPVLLSSWQRLNNKDVTLDETCQQNKQSLKKRTCIIYLRLLTKEERKPVTNPPNLFGKLADYLWFWNYHYTFRASRVTKKIIFINSCIPSVNTPFPNCFEPHYECEAKCKAFLRTKPQFHNEVQSNSETAYYLGRHSYNGIHFLPFLCFFFNLDFFPVLRNVIQTNPVISNWKIFRGRGSLRK